ncbi:uncharacterized protein A4U43_UnF7010 [Asparagus officinalis]|uniref:Uncharacterized protein n=1 Tax=Asparagus officinalis TaxID=4686 RepID=A0A1R3L6C0_ASPOF|nr:uncharacterized protein A4U43_UnF7010 [Asparagus officinalis]
MAWAAQRWGDGVGLRQHGGRGRWFRGLRRWRGRSANWRFDDDGGGSNLDGGVGGELGMVWGKGYGREVVQGLETLAWSVGKLEMEGVDGTGFVGAELS